MPDLVHCIYTSVERKKLSPADVAAILEQSRNNNRAHGITGILLHVGSTFFQVLEGPPEAIELLYFKILQDPRHHKITQIIQEPIARRFFGATTMSLASLSMDELAAALHEDLTAERTEQLLAGLDEGRSKRLLRAFSQGRWRARLEGNMTERQPAA